MDGTLVALVVGFVAVLGVIALAKSHARKKRREYLMAKYGDMTIVEDIMAERVWQGMSETQLIDSWGVPAAKDHKVYKTKHAETYKYNQTGKNRFGSRVMLEDGIVVGWKQNNS